MKEKVKGTWGGKRERKNKNKKEPTKVMRVPVSKVDAVKQLIGKK